MYILCFCVALFATTVGSMSGLGGGVIIKPTLSAFLSGRLPLGEIGALSSITVFFMAVYSTMKGIRKGVDLDIRLFLPLAVSSAIGGLAGEKAFVFVVHRAGEGICSMVQSIMMLVLMSGILGYYLFCEGSRTFSVRKKTVVTSTGFLLGSISAFLGIGGGPINVVALKVIFGLEERQQVFGSLLIILFAQGSKLLLLLLGGGAVFGNALLPCLMIAGGILGGMIGSTFALKLSPKQIRTAFMAAVSLVILITIKTLIG